MQDERVLSFSTKKNPAPTGEEEGRMSPTAKDSLMYVSMTSSSGLDRLYNFLVGLCGGKKWDIFLLKTCLRS